MDWVVLMKSVPNSEAIRVDRRSGTLVREGVTIYANPFDQRALRVALDQRRPGEAVTVLSMGPANAEAALRDARVLGADRSILVSDPALAGSDAFVTAKVLTAALRRLKPGLVLAGQWTTDSETGEVPPQIAARLGWPVVTNARQLVRGEDGGLTVDVDTETGWARYRVDPPAVVSVDEKIAKLRKLTPQEAASGADLPVERWGLDSLSIDRSEVGLAASPTRVERLIDVSPSRTSQLVADGSVSERVAEVAERLRASPVALPRPDAPPAPASSREGAAVLLTDGTGRLNPAYLPVLSQLRRTLGGARLGAIWVGPPPTAPELERLTSAGAGVVWAVGSDRPTIGAELAADAVSVVLDAEPSIGSVVVPADAFGRGLGAYLAVRRGLGLTGDAVDFGVGPDGRLRFHKPAFGGGTIAVIDARTRPALATLRAGAHELSSWPSETLARVVAFPAPPADPSPARLAEGREVDASWGELAGARFVVIIGQGAGDAEGVRAIRDLARSSGAAVGATRRVVDLGWAPRQVQVGLTGLSLSPQLALLVGVGGSMNHLIGLRRAGRLVAVNPDPAAPVFAHVDIGVVGRWQELLPTLIPAVARIEGARGSSP